MMLYYNKSTKVQIKVQKENKSKMKQKLKRILIALKSFHSRLLLGFAFEDYFLKMVALVPLNIRHLFTL